MKIQENICKKNQLNAVLQYVVVGENRTGNGVFDCHNAVVYSVFLHRLSHLAEGVAGQNLDLSTLDALGYDVVETTPVSLYCYLFHTLF